MNEADERAWVTFAAAVLQGMSAKEQYGSDFDDVAAKAADRMLEKLRDRRRREGGQS